MVIVYMPSFNEPSTSYDSIFPLSNCMLAVPDILLSSIVRVHVPWLPVIPDVPTSVTYQILPAAKAGALMATRIAAAFRARLIILSPTPMYRVILDRIWSKELAWLARRLISGVEGWALVARRKRLRNIVTADARRPPPREWRQSSSGIAGRRLWAGEGQEPHRRSPANCRRRFRRLGSPLKSH